MTKTGPEGAEDTGNNDDQSPPQSESNNDI